MRSLAQANSRRGKKHILDMLRGEGWRVGTCLMKRRSRAEGLLVPKKALDTRGSAFKTAASRAARRR
jgi:hypothetical protein